MARFAFALGVEGEVREAGVVQTDTFEDALEAISERYLPEKGHTLEIGVHGFPPARYEHTGYERGVKGWRPNGLMAA